MSDIVGATIQYLLNGAAGDRKTRLEKLNQLEKDAVIFRFLSEHEEREVVLNELTRTHDDCLKLQASFLWRATTSFSLGIIVGIVICWVGR